MQQSGERERASARCDGHSAEGKRELVSRFRLARDAPRKGLRAASPPRPRARAGVPSRAGPDTRTAASAGQANEPDADARAGGARAHARLSRPASLTSPTPPPPNPPPPKTKDGWWLREYDGCKALTAEVVKLVQERNMNHPQGGSEASRLTASARRKLGGLGGSLEALYSWLDGPEASEL